MAKAFSVLSWNIEHFGKTRKAGGFVRDIDPIIDLIAAQDADVVALYEVESSKVYIPIVDKMPGYQFHITEGPQSQEILVGVKGSFSSFVTQKLEFKSQLTYQRPGVLLTLKIDSEYYPILFLHLDSGVEAKDFGIRDNMIRLACQFHNKLKKAADADRMNFIFVGDLNTMGLDYPYTENDISAANEITELKSRAGRYDMKVLEKNAEFSWWNGSDSVYDPSNLDHVVAADHLEFKKFGDAEVDVRGWPKEDTDQKKDAWIAKYSDHGLIYFEVQKVV